MKIKNDHQTTAKYSLVGEEAEASKFMTERILKLDWQPWIPLWQLFRLFSEYTLVIEYILKLIF